MGLNHVHRSRHWISEERSRGRNTERDGEIGSTNASILQLLLLRSVILRDLVSRIRCSIDERKRSVTSI